MRQMGFHLTHIDPQTVSFGHRRDGCDRYRGSLLRYDFSSSAFSPSAPPRYKLCKNPLIRGNLQNSKGGSSLPESADIPSADLLGLTD